MARDRSPTQQNYLLVKRIVAVEGDTVSRPVRVINLMLKDSRSKRWPHILMQ
jgi:hypothetical protein